MYEDLIQPARSRDLSWPRDVVGLLALLTALLVYFQYTTLDKFKTLRPAVRYVLEGDVFDYIASMVPLSFADALVFGIIAAAFLALIVMELWKARFTAFLNWVFARERRTMVVLLLSSLVLVRFYFARGVINWSGDGSSHICYAWLASRSFAQGEIPIWTNLLGTGSPYLQFYGFLFFYVVGLLDQFFSDLNLTIKLTLAMAHVASALGMYCFVRRLTGSRRAGFVAGLGYVLCLWHTQQTLIMGRFPLSLFYALLPWPFYAIERLRFGRGVVPAVIVGGLTLGLLAFTHPGYAFWATAAFFLYLIVRAVTGRMRCLRTAFLKWGLGAWALGIAFGAYLTVPMWTERALVGLEKITHAGVPDPTWGHLFVWSNYRFQLFAFPGYDHWYGGYLGLSLLGLSLLALIYGVQNRVLRRMLPAVAVCFVVSLVLVLGYRWPGLRSLELVKAFNAGRYLLFVTFFLAAMAGLGAAAFQRHRRGSRIWALIFLVILADLGPTTFQHPYVPPNRTFLDLPPDIHDNLHAGVGHFPKGELPNFRLAYPMSDIFYLLGIAWFTVNLEVPSFLTGYREGTLVQDRFCYPFQALLNEELTGSDLASKMKNSHSLDRIALGLYLLNVRFTHVLVSDTQKLLGITWPNHSPIVVAPEVRPWLPEEDKTPEQRVEALVRNMAIDMRNNTCRRIFLSGISEREHLGTQPEVEVVEHRVWNQRVHLKVRVTEDCFARLAYAYYPYLNVYVDDRQVQPYRTAGDFIALKLKAGVYDIALIPRLSPLRRALLGLDFVLLIAAGYALWRFRGRRSPLLLNAAVSDLNPRM